MENNTLLVQSIFEQTSRGNVRALSDAMADDCRWTIPGNWSWSGTWGPRSDVLGGLLTHVMAQLGGRYRIEPDLVLADGDRAVVQARGYGTTTRGDAYHQTYCFVLRLADGRITEVIEHCDTALVERVLDPVAPAQPAL